MASLVQTDKFGAINVLDTTTMGYYAIKYSLFVFIIQEDMTTDVQVSKEGDLAARYGYLSIMKAKTN